MRKQLLLGIMGLGACTLAASFSQTAQSEPASTADVVLKGRGSSVGSALALADFRGVPVAIVADEDESMVRVFELSPAKEIASAKVPGTQIEYLTNAQDLRSYRVSFDRIRSELGFKPQRTVDDAIAEVGELLHSGVVADFRHDQFHNAKWLSANGRLQGAA